MRGIGLIKEAIEKKTTEQVIVVVEEKKSLSVKVSLNTAEGKTGEWEGKNTRRGHSRNVPREGTR